MSLLLTCLYSTPCCSVFIVNFEHVTTDWKVILFLSDNRPVNMSINVFTDIPANLLELVLMGRYSNFNTHSKILFH